MGASAADGEHRLGLAPGRLGGVETAAVAGDDAVELGESLDLVDDDAAHLRRRVGSLLRQLENAAAQLGARRLQLLLHFAGHLLHALHDLGEAGGGLAEHAVHLCGGLVIDRIECFAGALALFLGGRAHQLELLLDGAHALAARLGDDAGDLARPRRR